jgi:hypothetical protein
MLITARRPCKNAGIKCTLLGFEGRAYESLRDYDETEEECVQDGSRCN